MTENEKLRTLLAQARFWVDRAMPKGEDQHSDICMLLDQIDTALSEPLDSTILLVERERDEARAELAFINSEYLEANTSDLTRDGLAMQNAALKAEIDLLRNALVGAEDSLVAHDEHEQLLRIEAAEMAREAYERGAVKMRETAAQGLDHLLTRKKATAIWVGPDEIRALPIPEDK